jgi:hypothetical protein
MGRSQNMRQVKTSQTLTRYPHAVSVQVRFGSFTEVFIHSFISDSRTLDLT